MLGTWAAHAQTRVPVPRPKPEIIGQAEPEPDYAASETTGPPTTGGRASGATFYEMTGPVPVTWTGEEHSEARAACMKELDGLDITYKDVAAIGGAEGCGAVAPIEVSEVAGVSVAPPATLTCTFARQLHRWISGALQQAVRAAVDDEVATLVNVASYTCRLRKVKNEGRNVSEHGFANALDISEFKLRGGGKISITQDWGDSGKPEELSAEGLFLRYAQESACEVFTTVLGPDANALHKDHFHFDFRAKAEGRVTCR